MKDLMVKVYEEKMKNGDFEKIIGNKIDEAIKKTFDEMFGWNGTVKKELEAKLKEVMSSVIESSNFGNYVEKIKLVIDESVKGSNLETYKKTMEQIAKMIGKPLYDSKMIFKISELYEKYAKYVKEDLENRSYEDYCDSDEVEEGQVHANFSYMVEVEESENYFGDNDLTIVFKTTNDDKDEELDDYTFAFKLWKLSNGYQIHYSLDTEKNLLTLNDFELNIIQMKNANVKFEIDTRNIEEIETIYWDFEY